MKNDNTHKGMKFTEVGWIPKDWEIKNIGNVGSGFSYGVGAEAIPFDGTTKYIRITDIDEESHRFNKRNCTSPSFYSDRYILKENDIVVARTGASVGKSYIYEHTDGKLVYAGFLMKFNVSEQNSKYVFYKTTVHDYYKWVEVESARTGQPGLNLEQLKSYNFAIPSSPSEQKRIASVLSDMDSLISSLSSTIEKKRLIKKGTMQQLLSGETRLKGYTEKWAEQSIDNLFWHYPTASFSRDQMSTDGEVLCVHYGDIHVKFGHIVKLAQEDIPTVTSEQAGKFMRLQDGDIIMADASEDYEGIGKCIAVITNGKEAISGLHTILLRPKESVKFDHQFTSYILASSYVKQQIEHMAEGTKVYSITFAKIKDIIVKYPKSQKEQHAIVDILTTMDDEILALEKELEKYKVLKQGMMQKLLTGQIRLKYKDIAYN